MKRNCHNEDDSDCDIWNYKSANCTKSVKNKKVKSESRQSKSRPLQRQVELNCASKEQSVTAERCPSCQIPFHLIADRLRHIHVLKCLDISFSSARECTDGDTCKSTYIEHYVKFRHSKLAGAQAGLLHGSNSNLSLAGISTAAPQELSNNDSKVPEQFPFIQPDSVPNCSESDEPVIVNGKHIAGELNSNTTTDAPVSLSIVSAASADQRATSEISHCCLTLQASSQLLHCDSQIDSIPLEVLTDLQTEFISDSDIQFASVDDLCSMNNVDKNVIHKQPVVKLSKSNSSTAKQRLVSAASQQSIRSFFTSSEAQKPHSLSVDNILNTGDNGQLKMGDSYNQQSNGSVGNIKGGKNSSCSRSLPPLCTLPSTSAMPPESRMVKSRFCENNRDVQKCPFYKRVPGTSFTVDAFSYGTIPDCTGYFLSHFHADHYHGLRQSFRNTMYCSQVTANLVLLKIKVKPSCIRVLPIGNPQLIEGVEVTLLDANHCPGSVMFLFKTIRPGCGEETYLHTGDFRADQSLHLCPQLQSVHIGQLFLDTTYCDPSYTFPPQQEVINFAVQTVTQFLNVRPKTLVVVGSYTIGKERIFSAIANVLDCKICVKQDKKQILGCFEDPRLNQRLTLSMKDAQVHVVNMNQLNIQDLTEYLSRLKPQFDHILAFEPTGWTFSKKILSVDNIRPRVSNDQLTLYGIPYSEHSSYDELREFVQFVRPGKIIPTVNNGSARSRQKMTELFNAWMAVSPATKKPVVRQTALHEWIK